MDPSFNASTEQLMKEMPLELYEEATQNENDGDYMSDEGFQVFGDNDGVRPTSITVVLYANGIEKSVATVTPDANGDWAFSFGDLPKYEGGNE